MKIVIVVVLIVIVVGLFYADYRWRLWMDARRRERD